MSSADILDRPRAAEAPTHDDRDVAALTYRQGGIVKNWRSPDLDGNPLIGPWAVRALEHGRNYADLLYGELADLAISAN